MLNIVVLEGRLTADVNCKYANRGGEQTAVARFNMALDRGKDKEGKSRGADFPNVVAFGRTAEALEKYSYKGGRIEVTGHINTGSYEKEGKTVYTTDVIADRINIIDFRESAAAKTETAPAQEDEAPMGFQRMDDDDDIPF